MFSRFNNFVSHLMSNRSRLPRWLNLIIENVAKNPDGLISRLTDALLMRSEEPSKPTEIPDKEIKVFIGPTNYAGQGFAWARALEKLTNIGGRNLEIELPGGFQFNADSRVTVSQYNRSLHWQQSQFQAVSQFTHVLIEAERPLFGSLFRRRINEEIDQLYKNDINVALMCHGTDVRSPKNHVELTQWSPYVDEIELSRQHQKEVDFNLDLISTLKLPTFVSTPDLLLDVSFGQWCPVALDLERWPKGPAVLKRERPIVVHIPSMGVIKGTHLIEDSLRELDLAGIIEYRPYSGIASAEMPRLISEADIVLDQFRIGSYGVAAVEAMATGRIVLGHIAPQVRQIIQKQTGRELPIVEATPDTLQQILTDISENSAQYESLSEAGVRYAHEIHSGRLSSEILRKYWLERA